MASPRQVASNDPRQDADDYPDRNMPQDDRIAAADEESEELREDEEQRFAETGEIDRE